MFRKYYVKELDSTTKDYIQTMHTVYNPIFIDLKKVVAFKPERDNSVNKSIITFTLGESGKNKTIDVYFNSKEEVENEISYLIKHCK